MTTRRRRARGMSARRSSVKGRLRSMRRPATDTARLQPAITRLRMMPTSTIRCGRSMSARGDARSWLPETGGEQGCSAAIRAVRTRSTAMRELSVVTSRVANGAEPDGLGGHVRPSLSLGFTLRLVPALERSRDRHDHRGITGGRGVGSAAVDPRAVTSGPQATGPSAPRIEAAPPVAPAPPSRRVHGHHLAHAGQAAQAQQQGPRPWTDRSDTAS